MVNNYYTLYALAREWSPDLVGTMVADAFSQVRGELTLAFADPHREWMLRISTQAPFYFIFRSEGYSKARRNVATVFEGAFGKRVSALRVAERDRMFFVDLDDGSCLQVMLFGSRANVFFVDPAGSVAEAFQNNTTLEGGPAPLPRPAPLVDTFEAFDARWRTNHKTTEQAIASALPLFDRTLAAEVMHRAGVAEKAPTACTEPERRALFEAAVALRLLLAHPAPHIYWRDEFAEAFSLIPLRHQTDQQEESFDTVDHAVQVFVRRSLGQQRFLNAYTPLEKALTKVHADLQRRTEHMLEELAHESRADRYERWGHLLMASVAAVPPQAEEVTLPDLFEPGTSATIPLDPALTAVENAERYYDKARRTRQARAYAEERLLAAEQQTQQAADLLQRLRAITSYNELETFKKAEAAALSALLPGPSQAGDRLPFRRFAMGDGYEVWVGRNAKQNDTLTFRHARKYDLWMHARGVSGSHAVLRLPNRQAQPGKRLLERAAAIAAYFSKAQGSSLVPVILTPRKYVRKPKGAAPGAVIVEREEVLLVEPHLPAET
jgi:predicted ribosome quality control (RQC) complex YloA/Tae2 family protein